MAYSQDVKNKAYELYEKGYSLKAIADECNTTKKTIIQWKKRNQWDTKREKVVKKVEEKLHQKVTDFKAKQIRTTQEIDKRFWKYLCDHPEWIPDMKTWEIAMQRQDKALGEPSEIIQTQDNPMSIDRIRELYKKYKNRD